MRGAGSTDGEHRIDVPLPDPRHPTRKVVAVCLCGWRSERLTAHWARKQGNHHVDGLTPGPSPDDGRPPRA